MALQGHGHMHDAVEESPAKSGSSPIRRTTATSRNTTSPLSDCRKQWLFVPTGRTKASESRQPPGSRRSSRRAEYAGRGRTCSESFRRPHLSLAQPRTELTWRSRPRLRPDPHLRTAPYAVLPGEVGSSSPRTAPASTGPEAARAACTSALGLKSRCTTLPARSPVVPTFRGQLRKINGLSPF